MKAEKSSYTKRSKHIRTQKITLQQKTEYAKEIGRERKLRKKECR